MSDEFTLDKHERIPYAAFYNEAAAPEQPRIARAPHGMNGRHDKDPADAGSLQPRAAAQPTPSQVKVGAPS